MTVQRFDVGGTIVCTTPRVASTSISEALKAYPTIEPAEILKRKRSGARVIAWYRDPEERLESARAFFGHDGEKMAKNKDQWHCQIELHTVDGEYLPTVVYPFEVVTQSFEREFPHLKLPHIKPACA